jgi:hypothetical protein
MAPNNNINNNNYWDHIKEELDLLNQRKKTNNNQ